MSELACRADLCYNLTRNIVVSEDTANTLRLVTYLLRRQVTMDTLSPHADNGNSPQKQCNACLRFLPATIEYFHIGKRYTGGLRPQCKECRKADRKAYYSNPDVRERTQAKNKVYRETHKEQEQMWRDAYYSRPDIKERSRTRYKAYSSRPDVQERIRTRMKSYQQRPDVQAHLRTYRKDYYSRPEVQESNRIKARVYRHIPSVRENLRIHALNRLARKNAVSGTHTPAQIQDLLRRQRYRCYYCSKHFEKRNGKYIYHVDHTFPLSRVSADIPANDISYLVLACPFCNVSKNDRFPWEFPEGGRLL